MSAAGNSRYDAIIIGSGIGGLICGTRLAKAGYKGSYSANPSVLNNQYFDTLLSG